MIEIGFGVDEERHTGGEASTNAIATQPLSRARTTRARMNTPVFRFAPSPNGYLHLGHALSALINFEMARAAGGRFLLRIEDIDAARCRPQYEAAIYEDLAWLGITWEEPVRRQSIRASRAAARSRASSPSARRVLPGRAIPTACRSIPAMRVRSRRPSAGGAWQRASPMRCAWT